MSFLTNLFGGGIGDIAEKVGDAIHKNITTDKERMALENEAIKAEMDFRTKIAQMDTDLAKGQLDINLQEAKSTNWFVAGWRPACGWACVAGISYQFIAMPLLAWASTNFHKLAPPALDIGSLMTLLMGMLGLGAARTYEKVKDVHKSR